MSQVCQITGKRPLSGNNVSHANNKNKRKFNVNLKTHRIWVAGENRFVKLRLATSALRTIDKLGIEKVLEKIGKR